MNQHNYALRSKYYIVREHGNYLVKAKEKLNDYDTIIEEFGSRTEADDKLYKYLCSFKKAAGFSSLTKRLKALSFSTSKEYTLEQWTKKVAEQPLLYSNVEKMLNVEIPGVYGKKSGEAVPIDILIYDTIKLLNEKGYKTLHCCSGHAAGEFSEVPESIDGPVTKQDIDNWIDNDKYENQKNSVDGYSSPYITFLEDYDFNPKPPSWFIKYGIPVSDYPNSVSYQPIPPQFTKTIDGNNYDLYLNDEIVWINKQLYKWAKQLPSNQ